MKVILTAIALFLCFAASVPAQMRVIFPDGVKVVSSTLPTFPAEAKYSVYGDEIRVLADIDAKGRVKAALAYWPLVPCLKLNDPVVEEMRKAALAAAQTAVFEPIQKDGKTVEERLSLGYPLRPKNLPLSEEERKVVSIGVANGRATSLTKPDYPDAAKAVGARGAITVQILIDETGTVISAGSISGHPLFALPGMKAACSARFSPIKLRGEPAKMYGFLSFNFLP
jgi:hypothetical protein